MGSWSGLVPAKRAPERARFPQQDQIHASRCCCCCCCRCCCCCCHCCCCWQGRR